MKSVALITEYNPFHNGHLYHAQQSRHITNADVVIAIMSGQFMMRGMPAMYSKFTRTQMALQGVDLVVELPLLGSLSSSDRFAEMGIKIADYLDVDALSFGSESGDIHQLKSTAEQLRHFENHPQFQNELKQGKSYARIVGEYINDTCIESPNNILALSYLKQLDIQNSNITPYTITRTNAQHHQNEIAHHTFASGSAIRKDILNNGKHWQNCVPSNNYPLFSHPFTQTDTLFKMIQLTVLQQSLTSLASIYTMSEGFEHRLSRMIREATHWDDLLTKLKTKRYTHTHIQRILMNVLLNFRYEDVQPHINAVRILGMTSKGQAYLKKLKQRYPEKNLITNVNKTTASYFKHEIKATDIYNLLTQQTTTDFNTPVIIAHDK